MNIASLQVRIGADIKQLQSAMQRAQTSIRETGERMEQMGKTLTTRVTAPIAAMGAVAVRAFGIQEKAELQLRAALQANGRAVDDLFDSYNEFASEMQRITVVGDETTLSMLAQAESLGLTADSAQRAVKNSIAMQSAFGVNAESALRYTAALEQGNATMLTRYIPTLREIDDESERVAKAQEVLGNAFSAAESEAQGVTGQFTQMRNALGDMMEDIGEVIATAIMPFINRIQELAEEFQGLDKQTQLLAVSIAGVAAAVGPALLVLGKLAMLVAALMTPLALKVGLLTALALGFYYVYQNMGAFADRMPRVTNAIETVSGWVKWLIEDMRALGGRIRSIIDGVNDLLYTYDDWAEENKDLVESNEDLKDSVPKEEDAREFQSWGKFISGVGDGVMSVMGRIGDSVGDMVMRAANYLFDFSDILGDTADNAGEAANRINNTTIEPGLFDPVSDSANKMMFAVDDADASLRRVHQTLQRTGLEAIEMGQALQQVVGSAISDFATTIGDAFTGDAGARGFFNNILMIVADFGEQLGRSLVAAGVAAMAFQQLLTNPIAAIAAGTALIALSRVVKSLLASGPTTNVNDALITSSGQIVKFHPDDNILAMKDFSNLGVGGGGGDVHVTGELVARGDELRATLIETDRRQSRGGI